MKRLAYLLPVLALVGLMFVLNSLLAGGEHLALGALLLAVGLGGSLVADHLDERAKDRVQRRRPPER